VLNSLFPITEYWSWGTFVLYYLVAIFVVALCKKGAKINEKNNKQKWNALYVCATLILILLATVRTKAVGTDTKYYVNEFVSFSGFSFDWSELFSFHETEPAFQVLYAVLRTFTKDYHVLFFVIYSFVSFAYIYYIKNTYDAKDSYSFLPLFVFFFVSNMSGMRSAIGGAFLLISYVYLQKEKYKTATVLTLIGFLFHYSMIYNLYVIFAVFFFKNDYIKKRRWIWVLFTAISLIASYFGIYALKGLFAETKYDYYASVDVGDLSVLGSLFFVLFGIVAIVYYKKLMAKNQSRTCTSLLISLSFLITYPAIFILGAYRIPNYYAMPRLYVWSQASQLHSRVYRSVGDKLIFKIVLHVLLVIYLLFRFTRSSLDGGFIYYWGS